MMSSLPRPCRTLFPTDPDRRFARWFPPPSPGPAVRGADVQDDQVLDLVGQGVRHPRPDRIDAAIGLFGDLVAGLVDPVDVVVAEADERVRPGAAVDGVGAVASGETVRELVAVEV